VAGDDLALACRHLGDGGLDPVVELVEAPAVGLSAFAVELGVRRIGRGQPVGDVGDIAFDAPDILPAMGVGAVAMAVTVPGMAAGRQGRHADARHDAPALEGRSFGQAVDPALEAQPVAHQHLGARQHADVGRLGLVGVGVDVGADQHGEIEAVAADLPHQVAHDRESRHDAQFGLGMDRAHGEKRRRREKRATQHHVIS